MDFSKTTLHHILDSLASAECSEAILAQQIGNLSALIEKTQTDRKTTASLCTCRALLQRRLEELLQERGWTPHDTVPEE